MGLGGKETDVADDVDDVLAAPGAVVSEDDGEVGLDDVLEFEGGADWPAVDCAKQCGNTRTRRRRSSL
jgi:hypothetical protein